MSKKKSIVILMALLTAFVFLFSACESGETAQPPATETASAAGAAENSTTSALKASDNNGVLKIGISINSTSNEHNRNMYEWAQQYCKERGYEAFPTNAEGVSTQQATDIENLIVQDCDAIMIMNADKDGLDNVIQQAVNVGIIIVSYETGYMKGCSLIYDMNNYKLSSELFMLLAAKMGFEGKIIQCYDPTCTATRQRRNAQDAILKDYKDIVTANDFVTIFPGTVDDACDKTEAALLADQDIEAVWCVEDLVSLGALQACQALGRDDVIMIGIDGEKDVLEHIYNGGQQILATAIGDNRQGLEDCLDRIEDIVAGKPVMLYNEIPYVIITPANVADYYNPAS